MGTGAILVMWPRLFEKLLVPNGPGGCIWNLVTIGPAVSEEKLFEIVDGRMGDILYNLPISSPRSLWLRRVS